MTTDNFFEAEESYLAAQTIIADLKGRRSAEYAGLLDDLACLYQRMAEHEGDVESMYQEALDARKAVQGADHPDYAFTLYGMATWYERQRQFDDAALKLQQALAIVFAHLEKYAYSLTEREQLAYQQKLQMYLDGFLRCLLESGEGAETAYRQVLTWKGSTLVRQRAQSLFDESPELADLRSKLRTLVPQWAAMQTMLTEAATPGEAKKWQARFVELDRSKQQLELELSERIHAARLAAGESESSGDTQIAAPEVAGRITLEQLLAALPKSGRWSTISNTPTCCRRSSTPDD